MRRSTLSLLAILVLLVGVTTGGLFTPISNQITALRFDAAPREAGEGIVIAEIDPATIRAVGVWPWPRSVHATTVDRLTELGAAEIAFDVDFSSRSTPDGDDAFRAALDRAGGGVVLAAFRQIARLPEPHLVLTRPMPSLAEVSWPALVDVRPDPDGRVRQIPLAATVDGEPMVSMAAVLSGKPADEGRSLAIDFSIDPAGFDRVSLIDVLEGRVERSRIENRTVLIGATAAELHDYFLVPAHGLISGVALQALAAETLVQDRGLQAVPATVTLAGLLVLAGLTAAFGRFRLKLWATVFVLAVLAAAAEATATILQARDALVLDTAPWHVAVATFSVLLLLREKNLKRLLLRLSREENRDLRSMLGRVIEDSFAGILIAGRDGVVQAASREAATILHLDGRSPVGLPLEAMLPPPLLAAAETAIAAIAADDQAPGGDWVSTPADLRWRTAAGAEQIIEYVVTPSVAARRAPGSERETCICLMLRDVTEQRLAAERAAWLLRTDPLTGAASRFGFIERLGVVCETETPACLIAFDVDRFHAVNESFGNAVGDALLAEIARRTGALLGPGDLLARLGADGFAVLRQGCEDIAGIQGLALRIAEAVAAPFSHGDHSLSTSLSIGIAPVTPGDAPDEALQRADAACGEAREHGGHRIKLYDAAFDARVRARKLLERDLDGALERGEFHVVYQPQVDLATGRLVGVEALVRWTHPERGPISPADFIPIVEQIGLIPGLGKWVLREACREVSDWPMPLKVAVNLSPLQFEQKDLVEQVIGALRDSGLPPGRLALEITESLFLRDAAALTESLGALKRAGIEIALDDFGTGYSSLGYIRRFPLDKVKIDRSFVTGLPEDRESAAIIEAVIAMSRSLGFRVIAEGIESEAQGAALASLGCDEAQGYLYGRPMPPQAIRALLRTALDGERRRA